MSKCVLFVDRREERKSERRIYSGKWRLDYCFFSIIFLYKLRLHIELNQLMLCEGIHSDVPVL